MKSAFLIAIVCLGGLLSVPHVLYSQELEPRSLTNVPVGMNFAVLGYGYAMGNVLLDPAVPIENLNARINTVGAAYLRSINLFGLAGKVDAVLPWASGYWEGNYTGIDTFKSVSGMGDARFRLSVNLLGSPALRPETYATYKAENILGLSLQLIVPTGQYNPEKLINLGSNRWVFKPQLGVAHYFSKWIVEAYVSAWIFAANTNFLSGNTLTQKPLGAVKLHLIRSLPKNCWITLDAGYGFGGTTYLNDNARDTYISTMRFGMTVAVPVAKHHTFRLSGITAVRLEQGSDFDAMSITYQFRWLAK